MYCVLSPVSVANMNFVLVSVMKHVYYDMLKGKILYNWYSVQALMHASVACNRKLIVDWVPAGDLEDDTFKEVIIDLPTVATYVS